MLLCEVIGLIISPSPVPQLGVCLQRRVARASDRSPALLGARHGALCGEMSNLLQPATDRFCRDEILQQPPPAPLPLPSLRSATCSSSYGCRRKMIFKKKKKKKKKRKTPGAVRTSQLVPRQAIGGARLSVTVGRAQQSAICSGARDENKGRRGRRGTGRSGGGLGGHMALSLTKKKKKRLLFFKSHFSRHSTVV